ncbi:MAG: tetratricopeptide repeat protein [Methylomonas sp.]|jgi:tetratricopeptide (TPR) repeat protein
MKDEHIKNNPEAAFDAACRLINQDRLQEALTICRQLYAGYPQNCLLLNVLGSLEIRLGHYEEAVARLNESLGLDAEQAVTLVELGNALTELKRYQDALQCFALAIAIKPDYPEAYCNRGIVFNKLRQFGAARADLEQALRLNPDHAQAYLHRAYCLSELKLYDAALVCYAQAIQLKPDYAEAYFNRSLTLNTLKLHDAALQSLAKAIQFNPNNPEFYCNLGITFNKLKRYEEALLCYQQALALDPDNAAAYSNRGITLNELRLYEEALHSYTHAIALNPDLMEAYSNRGVTLHKLKRYAEALADYDHAITRKPEFAPAYANLGITLNDEKRYTESLRCFDAAIALRPNHAEAFYNRAITLSEVKNFSDSLINYDQAIALEPDYAEAYWNKALLKLLLGDFQEGWRLYEWRWRTANFSSPARNFSQPLWLGDSPIAGKTILLHAEQGLGDSLQFYRYVPMVAALQATVILEAPRPLTTLFANSGTGVRIVEAGLPLPDFDVHCPLLSLPLAFNTRLETIPAPIPYLLADQRKKSVWLRLLAGETRRQIGIVCSGSAGHSNDSNRSIPLSAFSPLFALPFAWHVLQKDIRADDADFLANNPQIGSHQSQLRDFSDTAALIAALDLIITVDTAIAHLAGAMGKPVWILLPFQADYRWLRDRVDSPWYPSAVLFRQEQALNWSDIILAVKNRLENR